MLQLQTSVKSKNKLIIDYKVKDNYNDKNLLSKMAIYSKEVLGVKGWTYLQTKVITTAMRL